MASNRACISDYWESQVCEAKRQNKNSESAFCSQKKNQGEFFTEQKPAERKELDLNCLNLLRLDLRK